MNNNEIDKAVVSTMRAVKNLDSQKVKFKSCQAELSKRTEQFLQKLVHFFISRSEMKSIINAFKIKQFGMKSIIENKSKDLTAAIKKQEDQYNRLLCKNKLLKLEKWRILKMRNVVKFPFVLFLINYSNWYV